MRTLDELKAQGRRILIRVDYNVPLDQGNVRDDRRIQASLPTLRELLAGGGTLVLMSHLGRPKGFDPKQSLAPIAPRLAELLGQEVHFIGGSPELTPASPTTLKQVEALPQGAVALLENVRFEPGEEQNDPELAARYAKLGEAFVLDAFGSAHRAHASVTGVAQYLPSYAGRLLEQEVQALSRLLEGAERPYWVILGGAKVSDKIQLIRNLLPRIDGMIVGGAMAFTFLKAQGAEIGASRFEPDQLELAKSLLVEAQARQVRLLLPSDVVIAQRLEAQTPTQIVEARAIPEGWMGVDVGPESLLAFQEALQGAKTVFWNGPMGVYEIPEFAQGTRRLAEALAQLKTFTVIGGGDSAAAVEELGLSQVFSHISTGGGASLEYLERGSLPGLEALASSPHAP